MSKDLWRYDRQMRFEPIGEAGQRAVRGASVVVVGCGALGSVAAEQLVRAGVGRLTVIDRDIVELHNLQRQPLFTEQDAARGLPKAIAAEKALREANSDVEIRGIIDDLNPDTAVKLTKEADVMVDGTDNFETRLLLNDLALERNIPWIYGGAVAAQGIVKAVLPGVTSCLRCLIDSPPPPGESPTCETEGIIAPAPYIVASLQVAMVLRLLSGGELPGDLFTLDAWQPAFRSASAPRLEDCPACVHGKREYLSGDKAGSAAAMCGRDTVQVLPAQRQQLDLKQLAETLTGLGEVEDRRFYLSFDDGKLRFSIFPDGRCLVHGTGDPKRARAAVAAYLGG